MKYKKIKFHRVNFFVKRYYPELFRLILSRYSSDILEVEYYIILIQS